MHMSFEHRVNPTPQPDFNDPADTDANLRRVRDANGEETLSGRLSLRWTPQ